MKKIFGLFAILVTSTALAQWTYAPSPDECVNPETGQRFDPSVDGRRKTREACGSIEDFEGWLASLPFDALKVWFESVIPESKAGISFVATPNPSGVVSTSDRLGQGAGGGNCTALTGFTCEAVGDATCEFNAADSNTVTITAASSSDEGNGCFAYKTASTSSDLHIEVLVPAIANWTGHTEDFTFVGSKIIDNAGYETNVAWPYVGQTNFKTDAGGAGESIQLGESVFFSPISVGYEYDSTGTSESGWESDDAWTSDYEIGTAVTKTLSFPVKYGVFVSSNNVNASTTVTVDVAATTTRNFTDAGSPGGPTPNNHDVNVSANTTTIFNCQTAGVEPGDTVTIQDATGADWDNKRLRIVNCVGASGNNITIKNDTTEAQQLDINCSSGFCFEIRSSKYFVLDGTGKWSGAGAGDCGLETDWNGTPSGKPATPQCGIKVGASTSAATTYLYITGNSDNFTIKGIEVDGKWPGITADDAGIGIGVNDNNYSDPADCRENVVITNNYLHDVGGVGGEGMYVGPNYDAGGIGIVSDNLAICGTLIYRNYVSNAFRDCIQLKSPQSGYTNRIYENIVDHCGYGNDGVAGQHYGINIFEGSGQIDSNLVFDSCEHGVSFQTFRLPSADGPVTGSIFNNIIDETGNGACDGWSGAGIAVVKPSDTYADLDVDIYNNTVTNTSGNGIAVGAAVDASSSIRDNILAGTGGGVSPGSYSNTNNVSVSIASRQFVDTVADPPDHRLTATSPDIGAATGATPATDIEGGTRDGDPDRGADEYGVP